METVTKEEIIKVLNMVLVESITLQPLLEEPWTKNQGIIQKEIKALLEKLEGESE